MKNQKQIRNQLRELLLSEQFIMGADILNENVITPQNVFRFQKINKIGISSLSYYTLKSTKSNQYDLQIVNFIQFNISDRNQKIEELIDNCIEDFDIMMVLPKEKIRKVGDKRL